jgi:hypothetical protein
MLAAMKHERGGRAAPAAALAAAALAAAAGLGGCTPEGPERLPNRDVPGVVDAGTPTPDVGLLSLTLNLVDNVTVCQVTVTIVTDAGPQMFLVPEMPTCPIDFPVTREYSFDMAALGGASTTATVTAIGRDGDMAVTAQGSAAVTLTLGFATDLVLALEEF